MTGRASRQGALGAALLLLVINVAVRCIPSVEAYDEGYDCSYDNRCPATACCWTGVCGHGPEFCSAPHCDCSGGYCDSHSSCPLPPPPPPGPPGKKKKKCFPGQATVQLAGGKLKTMEELALGDKVAVWVADTGRIVYDDVYAFGHRDALVFSSFVKIRVAAATAEAELGTSWKSATLELSPGHFVPTVQSGTRSLLYKRAKDIVLGDYLWVTNCTGENAASHVVTEICSSLKQGAFNPFTAQGSIVVDRVVASVHSDWFLDPLFDWLAIPHHLPAVYQAMLTPARVLYIVLGKELYIATHNFLDSQLNLAELATNHGGQVVATTAAAGLLALLGGIFLSSRGSRRYTNK